MMIVGYLLGCQYIDANNNITRKYKDDQKKEPFNRCSLLFCLWKRRYTN